MYNQIDKLSNINNSLVKNRKSVSRKKEITIMKPINPSLHSESKKTLIMPYPFFRTVSKTIHFVLIFRVLQSFRRMFSFKNFEQCFISKV